MSKKYSAILTTTGIERLANAAITGDPVGFTQMAVGDGGGALPIPDKGQSGLVNELYRSPLNRLVIADKGANIIRAEMIMPPQVGGFWLREVALFNDAGECLAVANLPESYKPQLSEGSGRLQVINVWIAVNSTADVQLITDPSIILATAEEVQKAKDEAKDYTDEAISSMNTNIKQAIAAAVRQGWELSHPVGLSLFFFENVNPNEIWDWSRWEYTGEDRTVRIARRDGSNVGQTGGSDMTTIARANLPAERLDFSGNTSEYDTQILTTEMAGRHVHQGGMAGPGEAWDPDYIVGSDNDSRRTRNNTSEAEDHTHQVRVPAHSHTVSGQTDALGQGQSISIVESHILQMCWRRVA